MSATVPTVDDIRKETRSDPLIGNDPMERWVGPPINQHNQRVAKAHRRNAEQNAARQAGKTQAEIEAEENEHILGVLVSYEVGLVAAFKRRLARLAELEKHRSP
jgi:hypothetical protein